MEFDCLQSNQVSQNLIKNSALGIDIVDPNSNPKSNSKEISISNPDFVTNTKSESGKGENLKGKLKLKLKKGIKGSATGLNQSLDSGDVVDVVRRSITDLPPALISEILNCLDPKDLGIVSCVSSILRGLASEHHAWKGFYNERWGLPETLVPSLESGVGVGDSITGQKSWKEIFVEREFRSKTFMGRYSMEVLYGHTEAVRTVFLLASAKLIFASGYDTVVRMWNMEDGLSIASSRPLGCTIRAVAADTRLLVAGGTGGFIHCWRAVEELPHLFDLKGLRNENTEVRLWGHDGPVTSLALDLTRIYSGSWDTTVRVWDRLSMKCIVVLRHSDWVWGLVPHDTTVVTTSGSDLYVWDTNSGTLVSIVPNAHVGNTYALARSHSGDFVFTGGEDGSIHMYEIVRDSYVTEALHVATWDPHSGPVNSLAFEFPWLVSASSDGKLALIDVRKLLRTSKRVLWKRASKGNNSGKVSVEPPQRMLHGYKNNLYSVDIGADRIVCGGEEGVVRVWNFTDALEIERRVRASRGVRLENRMRRRKLQTELNSKGGRSDQCSVVAKKNSVPCNWPRGGKTKV